MTVFKLVSAVALALSVAWGGAAFAMEAPAVAAIKAATVVQIKAGISPVAVAKALVAEKVDVPVIAAALIDAGVAPAMVTSALIAAGVYADVATEVVITAGGLGSVKDVVAAAVAAAPGMASRIYAAAIAAGADVTSLPATGAGPITTGGATGQNSNQAPSSPIVNSPSVGGGGGGAVSRN